METGKLSFRTGPAKKLVACALLAFLGSIAATSQAEGARRVAVTAKVKAKATAKGTAKGTAKTSSKAKAKPVKVTQKTSTSSASAPAQSAHIPVAATIAAPSSSAAASVPSVSLLPAVPPATPSATVLAPQPLDASAATLLAAAGTPVAGAVAPAPAPSPAPNAAVPAPVIAGIDVTDKTATLRLEPASPVLYARIRFSGVGFERFATEILGVAGQTTFSLGRPPDPNTQYTLRVSWDSGQAPSTEQLAAPKSASSAAVLPTQRSLTAGPETVKVLAPRFPQPLNRSPGLVAGSGWTSLLTSTLETTRRNPCAPWKIIYDDRNAPLDFEERLKSSIAQIAEASGVPIEYGGIERVDTVSDPQKLRFGWDIAATATLGLARQSYVRDSGGTVWRTTGTITMAARRRGITADRWHAVMLHELGHLFGLDHTNQQTSVMFSPVESGENWPYSALFFTETDRAGLFAMNGKATGGSCSTVLEDPLNP